MVDPYSVDLLWIVIVGFLIAFILAFGIGANDVANSFGTSVGSGVLTIRQACVLATIFEISGAVLVGFKVSDTMRKGILAVELYQDHEKQLMLGCLSALASSAAWLLVATFLKLPISGTHSIVGATVGFSLVAHGTDGIQWAKLGEIVFSWFASPVISGLTSVILFFIIRKTILRAANPFKNALISLPIFYGGTCFVNVVSILFDGPELLHLNNIPEWISIVASLCLGLLVGFLVHFFMVPSQRKKILGHSGKPGKPAKFGFEDSNESSPNGSPKRGKRPASLICDGKSLPVITETTELVSLTNGSPKSNGYCDPNMIKTLDLNTPNSKLFNGNYKIDARIIAKAENLLGKNSLDNTDLTITSLNFIDEQQNAVKNGFGVGNFFEQQRTNQLSPESIKNGKSNNNLANGKSSTTTTTALEASVTSPIVVRYESTSTLPLTDNNTSSCNNLLNNKNTNYTNTQIVVPLAQDEFLPQKDMKNIESGSSLDQIMSSTMSPNSSKLPLIEQRDDKCPAVKRASDEDENVSQLFSFLQVLTAIFGSFAHGGNDVSNAIGPVIALYMTYKEGSVLQKSETPLGILIFGGVGISLGLWLWGRRVIETIGNDLTKITASTGFTIEIGSALTVLVASKIGLPISTTHCKVGSVVFVGHFSSQTASSVAGADTENAIEGNESTEPVKKAVDWHLFRNIVYAWIVTVPVTALLSGAFMYILQLIVL